MHSYVDWTFYYVYAELETNRCEFSFWNESQNSLKQHWALCDSSPRFISPGLQMTSVRNSVEAIYIVDVTCQ